MALFVIGISSDTFKEFDYNDEMNFLNQADRKVCGFYQIPIIKLLAEEIRYLQEIYSQYHNSIKIFIGQLEVLQNKFPVEILNEIRAVFSHIAKAYVSIGLGILSVVLGLVAFI